MLSKPDQFFLRAVYNATAVAAMGGYPGAHAVIECLIGTYIGNGVSGSYVQTPSFFASGHGFPPERPEMHATFVVAGGHPQLKRGATIGLVHLVDIAPTIAKLLGLSWIAPSNLDGRILTELFAGK